MHTVGKLWKKAMSRQNLFPSWILLSAICCFYYPVMVSSQTFTKIRQQQQMVQEDYIQSSIHDKPLSPLPTAEDNANITTASIANEDEDKPSPTAEDNATITTASVANEDEDKSLLMQESLPILTIGLEAATTTTTTITPAPSPSSSSDIPPPLPSTQQKRRQFESNI
jgi:hypothetical protein